MRLVEILRGLLSYHWLISPPSAVTRRMLPPFDRLPRFFICVVLTAKRLHAAMSLSCPWSTSLEQSAALFSHVVPLRGFNSGLSMSTSTGHI